MRLHPPDVLALVFVCAFWPGCTGGDQGDGKAGKVAGPVTDAPELSERAKAIITTAIDTFPAAALRANTCLRIISTEESKQRSKAERVSYDAATDQVTIDELDYVELLLEAEDQYQVKIDDKLAAKLSSKRLGELFAHIESLTSAK